MTSQSRTVTPATPGPGSDLARLIMLEQELALRLEKAHAGDVLRIGRARAEAAALSDGLAAELEALATLLTAEATAESRTRIAALEAAAKAAIAGHDAIEAARVEALAGDLLAWLHGTPAVPR